MRTILVCEGGAAACECLGPDKAALGRGDGGEDRAWWDALLVDLQDLKGLLHGVQLVLLVVDDEGAFEACVEGLAAEDLGAQGVERGDGELVAVGPHARQKRRCGIVLAPAEQTLAHLPGGLVGEGDGGHAAGADVERPYHVGDAMRDDAGLAAARPGEDEQRPVDGLDGLELRLVESCQQVGSHVGIIHLAALNRSW